MNEFSTFFNYLTTTPLYHYGQMAFYGLIIVSWLWLVVQTLHDSERRFGHPIGRFIAVMLPLFLWIPGYIVYVFIRPSETITDRMYQKFLLNTVKLQENPSMCPTCHGFVKPDFVFCPHCGNQVLTACRHCGRHLRLDWSHCPDCGGKQ